MADDNRPLKYMRYAIGEIVLVVVGILIALQINTWNSERNASQLEFLTLVELKKSIESDLLELNRIKNIINRRIGSAEIVLKSLSNKQAYHDSLSIHFGRAMIYDDMSFHKGIYESIKSTGSQLINDDVLRFEINNYYDFTVNDMENGFREIRDDFYNYMLTFLREEFKYYNSRESKAEPRDFQKLKQNENYKLSLAIFLDVHRMTLRNLNRTITSSSDMIEKINERIEKIGR